MNHLLADHYVSHFTANMAKLLFELGNDGVDDQSDAISSQNLFDFS